VYQSFQLAIWPKISSSFTGDRLDALFPVSCDGAVSTSAKQLLMEDFDGASGFLGYLFGISIVIENIVYAAGIIYSNYIEKSSFLLDILIIYIM